MKHLAIASVLVYVFTAAIPADAAMINVQFEGQWAVQMAYAGNLPQSGPTVTRLPVDFVASVTFDPARSFYHPAVAYTYADYMGGGPYTIPPGPFSNVEFIDATVTSSTMLYGIKNPYNVMGTTYSSSAYSQLQAFNYFYGETSAPSQTLSFGTSAYSSQPYGNGTAGWNSGFIISSPVWSILPSDIGKQDEADFVALLQNAFESETSFDAGFTSYTILQSPGYLWYPDGFTVQGAARITSINVLPQGSVPEPSMLALVLLGGLAFTVRRKITNAPS